MTGGSGLPDVAADLPLALGGGDSANEAGFTAIVHGYGKDSTVLDALSEYNGIGNENIGLYQETIARPFRSLVGDVSPGSDGLAALIFYTDTRKTDRTNGIVCRPGSLTHPAEIAAEALGYMEITNAQFAEKGYSDAPLSGIDPGILARNAGQDWTTEYTNRDLAVHTGTEAYHRGNRGCSHTPVRRSCRVLPVGAGAKDFERSRGSRSHRQMGRSPAA
ncbi:MAG: hypothetical protein LBD47_01560 [Treponema sp.]|jgi:hypothetical protein|nr:hypothetical protein [Treponema sp.]